MFSQILTSLTCLIVLVDLKLSSVATSDCGCNVGRTQTSKYANMEMNELGSCSLGSCSIKQRDSSCSTKYNEMALIPSGKYQFGINKAIIEADKESPKRIVDVVSFFLDKYEVSNVAFQEFVEATDYKTEAEEFGDSFVFHLFLNSSLKEELVDFRAVQAPWWYKVVGADWRHPSGPDSDIKDVMDHPVIHVSWQDAKAYCKWRGARLPTEIEWEAACRGGHNDTLYPWGDKLFPNRIHMANLWQGTFPTHNSEKDGYLGTNPVDEFEQNKFGLYNIAGNVWEWTEDVWSEETPNEKVKKGGSFLCHRSYCYRYRCSARSHNTEDSSAGNLGFRCAKSADLH